MQGRQGKHVLQILPTHGCARAENTAGSQAHGSINVQESRPEGGLECSIMQHGLENFAYFTACQHRS